MNEKERGKNRLYYPPRLSMYYTVLSFLRICKNIVCVQERIVSILGGARNHGMTMTHQKRLAYQLFFATCNITARCPFLISWLQFLMKETIGMLVSKVLSIWRTVRPSDIGLRVTLVTTLLL